MQSYQSAVLLKDRTSNSTLKNQWAQWEQIMNPQPRRKKVGKPLQPSTGVLRRLQSHLGEAGLPVVWWVYEKLLRNTTSELFQSTFHNYVICTTVLKVWHLVQTASVCDTVLPMPPATLLTTPAQISEIKVCAMTALQLELSDICPHYFTWQHWLKAVFNFYAISTLQISPPKCPITTDLQNTRKHSVLSFDNLEASQSKYMLLSALLTV